MLSASFHLWISHTRGLRIASRRERKQTNKTHVFLTALRSLSCNCFCFCTSNKRESRSLLGCVLLKRLPLKKISLVTGSEMKGRGQERCSHSQAQHGGTAMRVCACIFVCRVSVSICFSTVSALLGPAVSAFATFSLLESTCFSALFVVCHSVCLPAPWSLTMEEFTVISVASLTFLSLCISCCSCRVHCC